MNVDGINQISYNGGGYGGSIMLQYPAIQCSGTILAEVGIAQIYVKGSGGSINFIAYDLNVSSSHFTGNLNVSKGERFSINNKYTSLISA
jgi:hypothetical protein